MNKKEIMKKAVALAKTMVGDWVARMALALKTVWAEVKKMGVLPALKGTEKQVKWANEIRQAIVTFVEEEVKQYISMIDEKKLLKKVQDERRNEVKKQALEALEAFSNTIEATFWIENFRDNCRYGKVLEGSKRTILEVFGDKFFTLGTWEVFLTRVYGKRFFPGIW